MAQNIHEDVTTTATSPARPLVIGGLIAAVVAGAATAAIAAVGAFAGISLVVGGMPIPVSGFAVLTVVFSVVGLVLALVLARTVRRPRTVFVRTTVVLTVLSLVPDALVDAPAATRVLLMLAHVVAAAIVVPAIARRLSA
ncbi:hypothetical protein EDD27_3390 [Nonomuraea polychroma]|uniref:Cell envelope biogenesis protein OmpA n=1 Tax=Nonomuraea polychroma TaxID=46176 RepID=A0A438M5B8_9ACTN|nr:DUF6069 family protein [Nonomuraea polychroma]RVX40942.1 hypothetical protein EDD27_3390 [Nonomuraea polychroma]